MFFMCGFLFMFGLEIVASFYQNDEFSGKIRSGPILTINNHVFFITNFHYETNQPAYFWIGNNLKNPIIFQDKTKKIYNGKDFYLVTPNHNSTIKYLGIWDPIKNTSLGYTRVHLGNLEFNENYEYDAEGRYIARIPKCCPQGTRKAKGGCEIIKNANFTHIPIYNSNGTDFDDEALRDVVYTYYTYEPKCKMYALDSKKDEYYLLNSGLLQLDNELVSKNEYCVDIFMKKRDFFEVPLLCIPEVPHETEAKIGAVSAAFAAASSASLFFLVIYFVKRWWRVTVRGYKFICFLLFMALAFFLLFISKLINSDPTNSRTCVCFGYLYQYFRGAYFVSLGCVIFEVFHRIRNIDTNLWKHRNYVYILAIIVMPLIPTGISLCFKNKNFDWASYRIQYSCAFITNKKMICYYALTAILSCSSAGLLLYTHIKIRRLNKQSNDFWGVLKDDITRLTHSNTLVFLLLEICWTAEVISYFLDTSGAIWKIIECLDSLQGVIIMSYFLYQPIYRRAKNCDFYRFKNGRQNLQSVTELEAVHRTSPLDFSDEHYKIKLLLQHRYLQI